MDYVLQDFMLFSPEVYWRLIQNSLNTFLLATITFNLLALVCVLLYQTSVFRKGLFSMLAILWAWLGWRFYIIDFADINWAASYYGITCLVQATAFIALVFRLDDKRHPVEPATLFLACGYLLAVRPFLLTLFGEEAGLTAIGVLPVPTLLLTLGVLLSVRFPYRWLVLIAPLVLLIVEGVTLFMLENFMWQEIPAVFVLLAIMAASLRSNRSLLKTSRLRARSNGY